MFLNVAVPAASENGFVSSTVRTGLFVVGGVVVGPVVVLLPFPPQLEMKTDATTTTQTDPNRKRTMCDLLVRYEDPRVQTEGQGTQEYSGDPGDGQPVSRVGARACWLRPGLR